MEHQPLYIPTNTGQATLALTTNDGIFAMQFIRIFVRDSVNYIIAASEYTHADFNSSGLFIRSKFAQDLINCNIHKLPQTALDKLFEIERCIGETIKDYIDKTSIDYGYGIYTIDYTAGHEMITITYRGDVRIMEWTDAQNARMVRDGVLPAPEVPAVFEPFNMDVNQTILVEARETIAFIERYAGLLNKSNSLTLDNNRLGMVAPPRLRPMDADVMMSYIIRGLPPQEFTPYRTNSIYDILGRELKADDIEFSANGILHENTILTNLRTIRLDSTLEAINDYLQVIRNAITLHMVEVK